MIAPAAAWRDWGGSGPLVHFGHANGFPPGSYRCLLGRLRSCYRIASLESRPLWPGGPGPEGLRSWEPLAEDLTDTLRDRGLRGILGVGHSLGAVLGLIAACRDPGLFRALVLVDPVLFTGPRAVIWRAMKRLGLGERTPIVSGALRRRDRWTSREAARGAWRDKPLFRSFRDDCFEAYLDEALEATEDGTLRLRYPKAWEAAIFRCTPSDPWNLVRTVQIPVLVLRGQRSDALTRAALRRCERLLPRGEVREVPGTGHMLPLEAPDRVAEAILDFLPR
ncbi:alpha/beta hydrolase [Myxococcota bacterium]|nr:alpha/beta hydrolase [Myxococcota bacterium]